MDERDIRQLTEEVYVPLSSLVGIKLTSWIGRNILEQLGSNDNIVRYHERFVDKVLRGRERDRLGGHGRLTSGIFFQPNNMLYILMEYCEGGDLAGVIQRCRQGG